MRGRYSFSRLRLTPVWPLSLQPGAEKMMPYDDTAMEW